MINTIKSKPWEITKKFFGHKFAVPVWVLILLLLLTPTLFLTFKYNPLLATKVLGWETKTNLTSELEKYLPKIQNLMTLPEETPQFATVSDVEKIRNQPFFSNAQNGDIVLVYQQSRKTILYRPTENKIIEVGTLNLPSPTAEPASVSATPTL